MDSIFIRAKQRLHKRRKGVCESSSSHHQRHKLFVRKIHWHSQKSCEVLKWNHRNSTPHRSETSGIAERAVRRVKESTLTVLLQSGLDEKGWADSLGCYCYMRNVQDLLADGKTFYAIRRTILKPNDSFWDNG